MNLSSEPTAWRSLKVHVCVPMGSSGSAWCYLQILVSTSVLRYEQHDQIPTIKNVLCDGGLLADGEFLDISAKGD